MKRLSGIVPSRLGSFLVLKQVRVSAVQFRVRSSVVTCVDTVPLFLSLLSISKVGLGVLAVGVNYAVMSLLLWILTLVLLVLGTEAVLVDVGVVLSLLVMLAVVGCVVLSWLGPGTVVCLKAVSSVVMISVSVKVSYRRVAWPMGAASVRAEGWLERGLGV